MGSVTDIDSEKSDFEVKISHVIETYKNLAAIPCPVSATLLPTIDERTFCIYTTWNTRDLIKSENTVYSRQFLVECSFEKFELKPYGMPHDITTVFLTAFAKSGKRQAIMRKKGKSTDDFVFLEIWNASAKECSFDMFDRKEHGRVYDNQHFGCLEWNADEKYILYIAEAKQPKSESHGRDFSSRSFEDKLNDEISKGEEYVFREDWGESLTGVHHAVLCVLEIETGLVDVFPLEGKYAGISAAQAVWGPNDEEIIFVGWKEQPRRLGLQYCTNRQSAIYSLNFESREVECISGEGHISVRSPRFSPDFQTLIYLENKAGGPHHSCTKLIKYEWETKKLTTLVDVVENPLTDGGFPGIYTDFLPPSCFSGNGKYVFLSTPWRSYYAPVCVNIETGKVQRLTLGSEFGRCDIFDVKKHFIVGAISSPDTQPSLVFGHIDLGEYVTVVWEFVDVNAPVKLLEINWTISSLTPPVPNQLYPDLKYEIILLTPEERKLKSQLIMIPHGGPHSVFSVGFHLYAATFVKLGFIVCLVNYRGSTGFGENSIKSLLGNVGCQDVKDVQYATEYLKNNPELNIDEIALLGGSHGGFLVAHLCGQYPDFYKAAACRNPVIDISGMVEVTDIPDWAWVETGHGEEFGPTAVINPQVLKCMWEKSPIRYIHNVAAPTLLLLGKKDLRVPASQGFKYYHILKARNIPVNVYYYDDNHGLSKVGVEGDAFMQIILWFRKYLSS